MFHINEQDGFMVILELHGFYIHVVKYLDFSGIYFNIYIVIKMYDKKNIVIQDCIYIAHPTTYLCRFSMVKFAPNGTVTISGEVIK